MTKATPVGRTLTKDQLVDAGAWSARLSLIRSEEFGLQ